MDEFAQTREPDNLFADDFTPIGSSIITHPVPSQYPNHQARRGGHASKLPPAPSTNLSALPTTTSTSAAGPTLPASTNADSPSAVRTSTAVRGDRSATGGISRPKLSESELSSRLAAAKLNNARREEAHRAAEADEASFHRREAEASQKRREEGVARKAMDGEREKNRLRKLGARGGREWDEGKQQQEISSAARGGSQYRRGVYGGTTANRGNDDGREQGDSEEGNRHGGHEDFNGRGYGRRGGGGKGRGGDRTRGERGRGRGRGGGRERGGREGGHGGGESQDHSLSSPAIAATRHPAVNTEIDFPSLLPPTKNPKSDHQSKFSNPSQQVSPTPPPIQFTTQQNTDTTPSESTLKTPLSANGGNSSQQSRNNQELNVEPFSPVVGEKQSWSDEVEAKTAAYRE